MRRLRTRSLLILSWPAMSVEAWIRLSAFALVFAAMALWEIAAPRRKLVAGRKARWPSNLGMLGLDALAVRVLIPTAAVGAALLAAGRGWGLFHLAGLRLSIAALLGFLVLDLVIYGQHVLFHKVPMLWRLHRMHHADLDIDVTTGGRFHPFEILISTAIKIAVVIAFGIPVVAVLLFEVVLNATSMFNHANVTMPAALDRALRWLVVTPDMHRVHHSILRQETDSNFGFNLPWWDRLFGTYRAAPQTGHDGITIGLPIFRNPRELRLDRLLTQPFRNDSAEADEKSSERPSR
jgi:sterol desaturase/sphingolipid hydroxylase (fatty acid hydroxylase superfamily)